MSFPLFRLLSFSQQKLFVFVIWCFAETFISMQQLKQRMWLTAAELNGGVILQSISRGYCRTLFSTEHKRWKAQKSSIKSIGCRQRRKEKQMHSNSLLSLHSQHLTRLCWKTFSWELKPAWSINVVFRFAVIKRPTLSPVLHVWKWQRQLHK